MESRSSGGSLPGLLEVQDWLTPGWEGRLKGKLTGTVLLSTAVASIDAKRRHLPFLDVVPKQILPYTSGMALFCVFDEALRAARGTHDAWNSCLAGALAGGLMTRHFIGVKHQRIGAVTWGVIATAVHVVDSLLKPMHIVEDILIDGGLLSPIVAERRQRHMQHAVGQLEAHRSVLMGGGVADLPDELVHEATRIRSMELAGLRDGLAGRPGSSQGRSGHQHQGGSVTVGREQQGTEAQVVQQVEELNEAGRQRGGWFGGWFGGERASKQAVSEGSTGVLEGGDSDDDIDEEDFKRWLASRGTGPEGLVLVQPDAPKGAPGASKVEVKPWWQVW